MEKTKKMVLCAMFAALIAAGAFIKIPVPVVPFTLQLLFTTLAGLVLGGKWGAISVLVYIGLGLIGVPVFTEGGGIAYVLKPTFGYIIGFAVGTFVTGKIAHKPQNPSFRRLLAASFAGLAIVYLFGMVYYYFISNIYLGSEIGVWTVFLYCFLMVVPGDILLCFLASALVKRLSPILKTERAG